MSDALQAVPPFPELEIDDATKRYVDQDTVDRALRLIYERRPDLFAAFAERERDNLDVKLSGTEFLKVLAEVRKEIPINYLACGHVLREACRRSRLMYGIPLLPPIRLKKTKLENGQE